MMPEVVLVPSKLLKLYLQASEYFGCTADE